VDKIMTLAEVFFSISEECIYLPKLTMWGWIVIGIIVLISFVLITKYVKNVPIYQN